MQRHVTVFDVSRPRTTTILTTSRGCFFAVLPPSPCNITGIVVLRFNWFWLSISNTLCVWDAVGDKQPKKSAAYQMLSGPAVLRPATTKDLATEELSEHPLASTMALGLPPAPLDAHALMSGLT